MKNAKVYLNTFQFDFEEIDSKVALVWSVKYKANIFHDKIAKGIIFPTFYQIMESKEDIILRGTTTKGYIDIALEYKDYIYKFKKFYLKYLKKYKELKNKYIKPYSNISNKHQKIIMKDPKIRQVLDTYLLGYLMYIYTGSQKLNIKEDEKDEKDDFDKQLNIYRKKGKLSSNKEELLIKLSNSFSDFPKYNKSFTVWRGINYDKNYKKGDKISQLIPFGTSLFPYVSRDFIHKSCCLLEIEVPKNYPTIFINEYDSWEEEVLLRQCDIEIISVKKIKKKNLYRHLKDPNVPLLRISHQHIKDSEDISILKCKIIKEL